METEKDGEEIKEKDEEENENHEIVDHEHHQIRLDGEDYQFKPVQ